MTLQDTTKNAKKTERQIKAKKKTTTTTTTTNTLGLCCVACVITATNIKKKKNRDEILKCEMWSIWAQLFHLVILHVSMKVHFSAYSRQFTRIAWAEQISLFWCSISSRGGDWQIWNLLANFWTLSEEIRYFFY